MWNKEPRIDESKPKAKKPKKEVNDKENYKRDAVRSRAN